METLIGEIKFYINHIELRKDSNISTKEFQGILKYLLKVARSNKKLTEAK